MFAYDARRALALLTLPIAGAAVAACFEEKTEPRTLAPSAASEGDGARSSFRIASPGDCGGSHLAAEDSCKGRADGIYCSTLRDFSAIKCENEQIVLGLQCSEGQRCVGASSDGTDIACAADDTPGDGAPGQRGFGGTLAGATDPLNLYAEECQAEVGLMPEFDCLDFPEIPTTQDGERLSVAGSGTSLVIQKNGRAIPGRLVNEAATATTPAVVDQWEPRPKCDNPSWASTPCYPGTRAGLVESGGASWAILCRRQKVQRSDDPNFDLVGVIAHNKKTGATCFFDKAPGTPPVTKRSFPQPGNGDPAIQRAAMRTWAAPDAPGSFENCLSCHVAGAFIRTPYVASLKLSAAMDPTGDYKVVGAVFGREWGGARAPKNLEVTDADCSSCHRLGATEQTRMFASIATGGADIDDKSSDTRLAKVRGVATRWPSGYFMPPRGRRLGSLEAWEKQFGAERDALHACLRTPGGAGCDRPAFDFF